MSETSRIESIGNLEQHVRTLLGATCTMPKGGKAYGGVLILHFGEVASWHGDDGPPWLRGEMVLVVECSWRARSERQIISSWRAADRPESGFSKSIVDVCGRLKGARITYLELVQETGDLTVEFDNGIRLDVFCDVTLDDESDNYSLMIGDDVWTLGERSHVTFSKNNS